MNPLTPYPITPIGNFLGVILALLPAHIPDSQAQPRGVGLCYMDHRVLLSDLCEHHYLARQRQYRGTRLVRHW